MAHESKKITVIVQYVGHDDFTAEFAPEADFASILSRALASFEIESSAASSYVLKFNDVPVTEHGKVDIYGVSPLVLTLALRKEVPKGHADAFAR